MPKYWTTTSTSSEFESKSERSLKFRLYENRKLACWGNQISSMAEFSGIFLKSDWSVIGSQQIYWTQKFFGVQHICWPVFMREWGMQRCAKKGNVNLKSLIFLRFAANAHRNSYTHCFLIFIQNICRGLLQYCLYKASVLFTVIFASWSNDSLHITCSFRTKCTLVQPLNLQKCKFASSIE